MNRKQIRSKRAGGGDLSAGHDNGKIGLESTPLSPPNFDSARTAWEQAYEAQGGSAEPVRNRSGIEVKPLYTPEDWNGGRYMEDLGFPGEVPYTRGIYPTMHRGRPWSQRQLIGLGIPEDYNQRLKTVLAAGGSAISLIPCNSCMRGYDADEVDPLLLGACGTIVNTVEDLDLCLRDIPLDRISTALNDPLPFTTLALLLALARRRNVAWSKITGTSNQSDYISLFVANHMFLRLTLGGSRRVLLDHIEFANRNVSQWNPLSIIGQHMQEAGATPAQAMGFTLSSAIQYAEDCIARGMNPDGFLPRFTFFFDVSISFFEEVAKLRAGRRIWARLVRERFGARDPRSARFKFHAQTSGADLTRPQPLNNITRVAVQAMAAIFGGLQSLHTDAYDEALGNPGEEAARTAICTQDILREEAHLADVIDPLGGSYYVETLTSRMEDEIEAVIRRIDAAGGMYRAVESGIVQEMIGESARVFQEQVESGKQKVVGVNAYQVEEESRHVAFERPDPAKVEAYLGRLKAFKAERSQAAVRAALDSLARSTVSKEENVYERIVEAAMAGATHGEIVACLRRELGFGQPLVAI
jgi:methylmalonyl-CoA mutase N-terminal domain/subunit